MLSVALYYFHVYLSLCFRIVDVLVLILYIVLKLFVVIERNIGLKVLVQRDDRHRYMNDASMQESCSY